MSETDSQTDPEPESASAPTPTPTPTPPAGRQHARGEVGGPLNSGEPRVSCGYLDKTDGSPAHALGTVRAWLLRPVFLSSDTSFDVILVSLRRYGA
ncbi:hypothetical protein ACFYXH_07275 [Streptomyces sp. NPDC002730]|uniref:hypothetical protein n=1 Tax=Streptomyces sp. NPDC002730 TaxID=3364662 RepID=UPI003681DEDB